MKREEQLKVNALVNAEFNSAVDEWLQTPDNWKRLLSCQAWVQETENYYILKSYNTIIACINKNSDTLFDALRTEYGYTATSAQHIAKFNHVYGRDKWGCHNRYTAR